VEAMDNIGVKQKIKIAYVLTPIDFGGLEKVSLNFLKNFNLNKFDIVPILLIRPWEDRNFFLQEIQNHKIRYHTIPVAIKPLDKGRDYLRIIRSFFLLFSILRKGDFDILHTNGYFADIIGGIAAKMIQIPHVSTCHGFIENDFKLRLYNLLDIFVLRFADRIISVADSIKDKLIHKGINGDKISIIQNAIIVPTLTDVEINEQRISARKQYDINQDEIFVGYVGRLSKEKGLKYLLEAGIKLRSQGLLIKIIFIGDEPERNTLEASACKNGILQQVIFTGFQKNAIKLLPAIDLFILPSLTEGTPMALLEAMSFGIPPIASRVGGIPKVITSGKNGVLVTPENSTQIAESILKLSEDNDYYMKLSRGAKNCINEKYNLIGKVDSMESIYLSLAN